MDNYQILKQEIKIIFLIIKKMRTLRNMMREMTIEKKVLDIIKKIK